MNAAKIRELGHGATRECMAAGMADRVQAIATTHLMQATVEVAAQLAELNERLRARDAVDDALRDLGARR
jgi:hypothetical protein